MAKKGFIMRFENGIAKQTTKFENVVLNNLKYSIMDGLDIKFEALPDDIAYDFLKELYNEAYFKDNTLKDVEIYKDSLGSWCISYFDTLQNKSYDDVITMIPSNLETLICGYRMVGKHRKVAMLKRRYPNKMRAARV